jgi:PiT family inorganic phosphate transporter
VIASIDPTPLSQSDRASLQESKEIDLRLQQSIAAKSVDGIPNKDRFAIRKDILVMDRQLNNLLKKEEVRISSSDRTVIKDNLKAVRKVTDYSPGWVILMIALSLGLGTMIGWKRIVKTIGEKIGKEHLTYAQGASAELVAASTIGMSSYFGLPVSTTHVLSSGVAGSMVASKGVKNLQPDTVRNILLAWFLTLPVVMTMAGSLFLLFRSIF